MSDESQSLTRDAGPPESPGLSCREGRQLAPAWLADLPLELSVSMRAQGIRVRDLIGLETGSLLPCRQSVGEPFDVLVNDTPVARGEIVVLEGRLAVRLVRIGSEGA